MEQSSMWKTAMYKPQSASEFAGWGVPVVAYVKPVDLDGIKAYALHGADGAKLAIESSEDLAALAARQKNLFPVLIQ